VNYSFRIRRQANDNRKVATVKLSTADVWDIVRTERKCLIEDLSLLERQRWNTPSLCPGWSVHDVLAHLVDTAKTGKGAFVWNMVRARGNFDLANDQGIARHKNDDPQQTLAVLSGAIELTKAPPANRATRLVEAIVHGEDIRRPLHIEPRYPHVGVLEALDYQIRTAVSFGGGRDRARGVLLRETDSGSTWGEGPEVSAQTLDLLLTVSGRHVDPTRFTGGGAAQFLRNVRSE
jgi:uncharacterized protein (TIGR03083 family)